MLLKGVATSEPAQESYHQHWTRTYNCAIQKDLSVLWG